MSCTAQLPQAVAAAAQRRSPASAGARLRQPLSAAPRASIRRPARLRRLHTRASFLQDEAASAAAYDKTDSGIKALVGGLTGLVNAAFGVKEEPLPPPVGTVTPEELLNGLEEDFTVNGCGTGPGGSLLSAPCAPPRAAIAPATSLFLPS